MIQENENSKIYSTLCEIDSTLKQMQEKVNDMQEKVNGMSEIAEEMMGEMHSGNSSKDIFESIIRMKGRGCWSVKLE